MSSSFTSSSTVSHATVDIPVSEDLTKWETPLRLYQLTGIDRRVILPITSSFLVRAESPDKRIVDIGMWLASNQSDDVMMPGYARRSASGGE